MSGPDTFRGSDLPGTPEIEFSFSEKKTITPFIECINCVTLENSTYGGILLPSLVR